MLHNNCHCCTPEEVVQEGLAEAVGAELAVVAEVDWAQAAAAEQRVSSAPNR